MKIFVYRTKDGDYYGLDEQNRDWGGFWPSPTCVGWWDGHLSNGRRKELFEPSGDPLHVAQRLFSEA